MKFASLLLFAVVPLSSLAEPVRAEGFTFIRSLGGIDEYRLDANGLQVLLAPRHFAPVATFNVTYRVGSRNEVTGTTGATHLVEHLMFKGGDNFNDAKGNSVKQYLERVGGNYNATTSLDRTNYFATVGRDDLEGYVAIEADRMRNLWIRESDRQSEMTVVRNEFERGENDPNEALSKEVLAAAYMALPYHHDTIGWKSDIEGVPIAKLRAFYDTFYWPNNATAVIVGDFDPAAGLGLIRKYYGAIPHSPQPIPVIYTQEPEQTGPRRVAIKRPAQLGSLILMHKVCPGLHDDLPALRVLDAILAAGKNSRFYRALIDTNLTTTVTSSTLPARDLSPHWISASLASGVTHAQVEEVIVREIARVQDEGVSPQELASAQRRLKAASVYGRDGTDKIAGSLNAWIAAGDWSAYVTVPEKIERVTAADVQRAAKQYLDPDQGTTGWFVPVTAGPAASR